MYTARQVATVLGLPSSKLRSLLRAGLVQPERDDSGSLRFSFRDLVLLRSMGSLATKTLPRRLGRTVRRLHGMQRLLGDAPTRTGITLRIEGSQLVLADGRARWHADSGQLLMDFYGPGRQDAQGAEVVSLSEVRRTRERRVSSSSNDKQPTAAHSAQACFERGCALEDVDPAGAQAAYEEALRLDPQHADARVNLGRLLHEDGHPDRALVHYRMALSVRPEDPTACFNMGVALEDTGQTEEAIRAYQASIAADPGNADAHYNLARLLELNGQAEIAFQHLMIYRQLTRAGR